MPFGSASSHQRGREALARAWPIVTGSAATLPELQIAGAQAHLESGYGMGSYLNKLTGERRVLNNWGAISCGKPPCGDDCFEATDTHKDGTEYQQCYRIYATPEDGARHIIEHMTVKRPTSWEHMKRGDIDAWARQMYAYKLDANGNPTDVLNKDPETGVYGYFEQHPSSRAHGIELRIAEIAVAMGEPIWAKRGGPTNRGGPAGSPWFDFIGSVLAVAAIVGGGAAVASVLGPQVWAWALKRGLL